MIYWLIAASAAMAQASAATVAPPTLPTAAEVRANPSKVSAPLREDAKTVAEIRALEKQWGQAFLTRDFALLERIIAPQFRLVSFDRDGTTMITPRVDWMRNLPAFRIYTYSEQVLDVMTAGDTAVALVDATWAVKRSPAEPARLIRFIVTDTWLRRNSRWQAAHRHSRRVSEELYRPGGGQNGSR